MSLWDSEFYEFMRLRILWVHETQNSMILWFYEIQNSMILWFCDLRLKRWLYSWYLQIRLPPSHRLRHRIPVSSSDTPDNVPWSAGWCCCCPPIRRKDGSCPPPASRRMPCRLPAWPRSASACSRLPAPCGVPQSRHPGLAPSSRSRPACLRRSRRAQTGFSPRPTALSCIRLRAPESPSCGSHPSRWGRYAGPVPNSALPVPCVSSCWKEHRHWSYWRYSSAYRSAQPLSSGSCRRCG